MPNKNTESEKAITNKIYGEGELRQIKFRAWDIPEKRMCQVFGLDWNLERPLNIHILVFGKVVPYSYERFILMQFTGLHDKNGKEIFESDIVKHNLGIDEVVWRRDGYFVGDWTPVNLSDFDCEVLGNIHENPELVRS